ncbi:hypothetical protein GGI42DRAFT_133977 [Trichoderma sp. SZMC 28013]
MASKTLAAQPPLRCQTPSLPLPPWTPFVNTVCAYTALQAKSTGEQRSPIIRWPSVDEVVWNVTARDRAVCSEAGHVRGSLFKQIAKQKRGVRVCELIATMGGLPVSPVQDVVKSNWRLSSHALQGHRHSVLCCPTCGTASEIHNKRRPHFNGASWLAAEESMSSRAMTYFRLAVSITGDSWQYVRPRYCAQNVSKQFKPSPHSSQPILQTFGLRSTTALDVWATPPIS